MERILIFIKHHLGVIWIFIEWINGLLFRLMFKSRMNKTLSKIIAKVDSGSMTYRELQYADIQDLVNLLSSQNPKDLEFFQPHGFDLNSLHSQFRKPAFLMMGTFDNSQLVGYFFLRFFTNRKCFVGRLINREHRGQGIGLIMNQIMYTTAWNMGFRCLSTISKNNRAVMRAHAKNQTMRVVKELDNNYLLVEFVQAEELKS